MARNDATVGITVEAKTAQAQRSFDRLAEGIEKTKRATHETDKRISAFGKALKEAEAANQRAARSSELHQSTLDKLQSSVGGAAAKIGKLTAVLGAAGLVAAGTAAISKLGELANESVQVQGAFDNLQIGIGKAKVATGRLVGDLDLATRANQAASLGVAKTSDEFAELARAAQILGAKLGTGTLPALDSLIGAVGRGSTLLLDNLGIAITEVTRREKILAEQTGKTTSELTDQEKAGIQQGAAREDLNRILDNAGAKMGSLRDLSFDLARAESELTGGSAELAAAQEKQSKEAEEFRGLELEAVKESLKSITEEVALAEARGDAEREILSLKVLQAETQADLLELEGKTKDATDKRFEAELNQTRLENLKTKKRGRGGGSQNLLDQLLRPGKMQKEARRADPQFSENRDAELQQLLADAGLTAGGTAKISDSEWADLIQQAKERAQELEAAKADSRLQEKLRGIERERAEGVDAFTLIEKEEEAQLEHLEFLRQNTQDAIELERIRDQEEAVHHEARMKRLAQEKAERQKLFDKIERGFQITGNSAVLAANLTTLAAEAGIRSEKRKAKIINATAGAIASVQAALEIARSIASFAMLNIPGGIAHAAAAAAFTTAAVQAFREAGSGGAPRHRSGGGITGASFGGGSVGPSGGGTPTGSVGPSGGGDAPSAPISMPSGPTAPDLGLAQASSASRGGGAGGGNIVTVNFNGPRLGRPSEQELLNLSRDMERAMKTAGKAG